MDVPVSPHFVYIVYHKFLLLSKMESGRKWKGWKNVEGAGLREVCVGKNGREVDTFPIKDRVEVIARALSGKNDQIRGISSWDLEVCDVYDQDDWSLMSWTLEEQILWTKEDYGG